MVMGFNIERNFVACTSHITEQDDGLLSRSSASGGDPWVTYPLPYGYLVVVATEDPEVRAKQSREMGYSEAFLNLVKLAQAEGCKFLLLDRDGDEYAGLPRHDW